MRTLLLILVAACGDNVAEPAPPDAATKMCVREFADDVCERGIHGSLSFGCDNDAPDPAGMACFIPPDWIGVRCCYPY